MRKHANNAANVGRVSTRQAAPTGGWKDITLGDFVALQRGHDLTEPERRSGHVPVIGSAGQNGFHDTALAKGPGIVIGRSGASFGQVHFCATDYWPHNTGLYVTDFKGNDPRFTYYFLKALDFDRYNSGSAQPSLNRNFIYPIPVCVPEPDEQKAIAHILGTLDDKIELNRRMNVTLEAMARALFQSWFVDFDPVRAKLDGRQPAGLDPATAALFPAHFQESPLGHIPQGWKVKPLSEITTVITKGTTPTQEDMVNAPDIDSQVNYVRVNSIEEDGSIIYDKLTKIPLSVHTGVLKRSILQANDVLYTIAGTIGRIATAEHWVLPANTNQAVAIIRPKSTIPSSFLVLTMQHEVFREELHNNIVHAVQANLSLGMLSKARAVVPPEDVLLKIFKPIDDIMSQISANRAQSRTLATIRDALLPKLLSGDIRVTDDENEVASV